MPVEIDLAGSLEQGRLTLASGRIATANSAADLSAGVLEFAGPRARMQYDARISIPEVARLWHAAGLDSGEVRASGAMEWNGGIEFATAGGLRASGVGYRDALVAIRNGALAGAFTAGASGIEIREAAVSAACRIGRGEETAQGRIAAISLRGRQLELRGIALATMGGMLRGQATLRDLDRYQVDGEISGFAGRRLVALYSAAPLPWDALAAGTVRAQGSLLRRGDFRAEAEFGWRRPRRAPPCTAVSPPPGTPAPAFSVWAAPPSLCRLRAPNSRGRRATCACAWKRAT